MKKKPQRPQADPVAALVRRWRREARKERARSTQQYLEWRAGNSEFSCGVLEAGRSQAFSASVRELATALRQRARKEKK